MWFLLVRVNATDSLFFGFLIWNLVLAWLPLAFGFALTRSLKQESWRSLRNIVFTLLWLGFLPNCFYLISDFVHLDYAGDIEPLYDVVLLTSFAFNGMVLGFAGIYLVHKELLKRLSNNISSSLIGAVLLVCSFAIYLGRYLRWNTWDILVKPAGLLFDVSDRLINPAAHGRTFGTTITFFILLSSMYFVIWQMAAALQSQRGK
jgi:uncharacterized membrane protein